jgi:hypothetical protein
MIGKDYLHAIMPLQNGSTTEHGMERDFHPAFILDSSASALLVF